MKKVLSILLTVTFIATLFIGCGKSSENESTLSGYLSSGQRIFIAVDCEDYIPAKDTKVGSVIVFNDDGTYMLYNPDKTLGELEQMEDSEIIEAVENGYKEIIKERTDKSYEELKENVTLRTKEEWKSELADFFNDYKGFEKTDDDINAFVMHSCNFNYLDDTLVNGILATDYKDIVKKNVLECKSTEDIAKTADNIYSQINACWENSEAYQIAKKGIDDYVNNPINQYKIVINTDSTGNNTAYETIVFHNPPSIEERFMYIQDTYSYELREIDLFGNFADMSDTGFQIYDSTYYGYTISPEDEYEAQCYLLTRGKNLKKFTLDPVGTKDISTDNVDELMEEQEKVIFDIKTYIKGGE